jgi:protein SCO1/2
MGLYERLSRSFGSFFDTGDPENPPRLHRNPWFLGIVVLALLPPLVQLTGVTRKIPDPPAVVQELPDFSLIDQDGEPFTKADLAGRVHITGFFFTTCTTICPRLLQVMKTVQDDVIEQAPYSEWGDDIRFLAITVDPKRDTPDKLRETIVKYGFDASRWTLLTGPREDIVALVEGGFGRAVGERQEVAPGVFDIAHSNKLALVDGAGRVRGFYGTENVSDKVSMISGAPMGTDFDGPEAIRGWAGVLAAWQHAGKLPAP